MAQQRLGQFWLAWRNDREEWAICWNDPASGFRRRKSTGVRDYNDGEAPSEASEKLAEHFKAHGQLEKIDPNAKASLTNLLNVWLAKVASKRTRSEQYACAIENLLRWINSNGGMMVSDINVTKTEGYIDMRLEEGVRGETIHGELSTLRTAMNWAADKEIIPYVPRVAKVPKEERSEPRDIEYSHEQVAAILDAANSRYDRQHVLLFSLIMLSTHSRVEAVLELDASQIREGLIFFNARGRKQTTKRRSIVPVVPTLKPWLPKSGKVIQYRAKRKDGQPDYVRDTYTIKNAFAGTLIDAGLSYEVEVENEKGEIEIEVKPWGYPNALRHTIHTQLQRMGVPQAQIDAAAGHSSEIGSGRNYTHLRPGYLKEFCEAVEEYWAEIDQYTRAHRSHVGPKVFDLKTGMAVK